MSRAIDLLIEHSQTGRRLAILGGWCGLAMLILTGLIAHEGDAWKAAIGGLGAGALLMGAALTYAKVRLWERVAISRQAMEQAGTNDSARNAHGYPSPTAGIPKSA